MSAEIAAACPPDSEADWYVEGRLPWGKSRADLATRLIHNTSLAERRGPPQGP
jgi:hypothetical protein